MGREGKGAAYIVFGFCGFCGRLDWSGLEGFREITGLALCLLGGFVWCGREE